MNKTVQEFDTVLLTLKEPVVTDVHVKKFVTYFSLGEHKFATYGHYIYHQSSPMYRHPALEAMAKMSNDPVEILKGHELAEETNNELDLWYEHKREMYKKVITRSVRILEKLGEDAFVKYLESNFFLTAEGKGKSLLKKIAKSHETTGPSK